MGVTQEYFFSQSQPRIEDVLLADEEYVDRQFLALKAQGLQALCRHKTYRCDLRNEQSFEVSAAGSYKAGFCTISLHQQSHGLRKFFLRAIGNHSLHDVTIFFPSEQYPGEPHISYMRAWPPTPAKRIEDMTIDQFINQVYTRANSGLLTRRQKKILRFVEQGNKLLQE